MKKQANSNVKKTELGQISNAYLVAYNLLSGLGWLYILFGCVRAMLTWRTRSDFVESKNVYEIIRAPLKFFLATAFLEIFHAMLKLVKSSPIITFNQVFIRFLVVWGIVENFYTAQRNYGLVILGIVWSLSETIRYFYYLSQLINFDSYPLKWSRYNFFIVLYPLGVMGEITCILMAARYVKPENVRDEYSLSLPNVLNFSYDFYIVLWIWIALYLPGFPYMYVHMLNQRTKILYQRAASIVQSKKEQ